MPPHYDFNQRSSEELYSIIEHFTERLHLSSAKLSSALDTANENLEIVGDVIALRHYPFALIITSSRLSKTGPINRQQMNGT